MTLECQCRKRWGSGFELSVELSVPLERSPVTVLFGPSGSGKTTLLRLIAGLERSDEGTISFRERVWYDAERSIDLPPQQRRAGFLFQDSTLFPHMSVARNVAYAAAEPSKVRELIKRFGLGEFAARSPADISGGQRQRVALARALAAKPDLLLLDEPLSALDAVTRSRTRYQLRRMLLDHGVPAIVVTHDRMDAIALGDWMAVMVEGRVLQFAPVQEVFRYPSGPRVAESVGVENVFAASITGREAGLLTLAVGEARLQAIDGDEAGPVFACIHAEDIALTRDVPEMSTARNRLRGAIRSVVLEGPLARVELDCGFPLVAVVTAQSAGELGLEQGMTVWAVVKSTAVHVTAAATAG